MSNLSKRARELISNFGDTKNMRRLTKELKSIQKAEKEMKLASSNITKILKAQRK